MAEELILVLLLFPVDAHVRKESQIIYNVNNFVVDSSQDVPHISSCYAPPNKIGGK